VPRSVIFLDLDDVLIVPAMYKIKHGRRVRDGRKVHYAFAPAAKELLLHMIGQCPDTALVISSTWRLEGKAELAALLRLNGCGDILNRLHEDWLTCEPWRGGDRAAEIAEWLSRHPEVTRAAAVDNDASIGGQPWAVLVDPETGLSERNVAAAIALISRQSV
jgi:hypothetical protein